MFTLTEDEQAITETARDFADEYLAPHAVEWDQEQALPGRRPAQGGRARHGRHLHSRGRRAARGFAGSTRVRIFEQLATGCPSIAAYISIHNMVAWMIDRYGTDEQRQRWLPRLCTMEQLAQLLPDRARRRLRRGGA